MSRIYNKNAREKALLEEAYAGVYQESSVDVELDHWWDFDIDDVIRKVYHGARGALPPEQGTPEYEENSEKIVIWLKDKYPKPNDYNINDVKFQSRTTEDATRWANRQDEELAEGAMDDFATAAGKGIGSIGRGLGRIGAAGAGALAAGTGAALGGILKLLDTLTAEQLTKIGNYALEKAAEDEENDVPPPPTTDPNDPDYIHPIVP